MPDKFTAMTPELFHYAVEHSSFREEDIRDIESQADDMGDLALMQIAGDQAALITILVRAIGARRCLEVGTFLGYGAVAIARGLPEDGRLICLELEADYAERARENLHLAGLDDRVEIRVGAAADSLRQMTDDGAFDFAFIDADKVGYPEYYEQCLRLLRSGGLIVLDNVFMAGRILDPADEGSQVVAALNDRIAADDRVDATMLSVADGVTLALKR